MAAKKKTKKKGRAPRALLTDRQRRDLLGLSLVLLALFTALSLVPPEALGPEAGVGGNLLGVVGATFQYGASPSSAPAFTSSRSFRHWARWRPSVCARPSPCAGCCSR